MLDQTAPSQRRAFSLVENGAFMLGAVLVSLLWALPYMFARQMLRSFDFVESRIPVWEYLGVACWVSLAGAFAGLTFKAVANLRGRAPSICFAFAIPLFGTVAYSLVIDLFLMRHPVDGLIETFLTRLFAVNICAGLLVIPLSVPHVKALQWLDQSCARWASKASPRATRHMGFGLVSVAFLLFTEGVKFFEARREFEVQRAARVYKIQIPDRSVLLSHEVTMYEDEGYARVERSVLRLVGDLPWPPVMGAYGLSDPEPKGYIFNRLKAFTGAIDEDQAGVRQTKWPVHGGVVVCTKIRVGSITYLDLALTAV